MRELADQNNSEYGHFLRNAEFNGNLSIKSFDMYLIIIYGIYFALD